MTDERPDLNQRTLEELGEAADERIKGLALALYDHLKGDKLEQERVLGERKFSLDACEEWVRRKYRWWIEKIDEQTWIAIEARNRSEEADYAARRRHDDFMQRTADPNDTDARNKFIAKASKGYDPEKRE